MTNAFDPTLISFPVPNTRVELLSTIATFANYVTYYHGETAQLSLEFRRVNRFLIANKTHAAELTWTFDDQTAFPGMFTFNRNTPFYNYLTLTVSVDDSTHLKYYFLGKNQRYMAGSPVKTELGDWPLPIEKINRNGFRMYGRQNLLEAAPEELGMKMMEKLTEHFLNIFYIDGYNLKYGRFHGFDIFKSFIWNFTRKFKNFSMTGLEINKENGRILLKDLEIDNLYLFAVNINDFNDSTTVNMNQSMIKIHRCNWLTINHIIEAHEAKLIDVGITILDVSQLVELVTLWRNGQKLRNLEKLKIEWTKYSGYESENLKELREKMNNLGVRYQVERVTDGEIALLSFGLESKFKMVLQKVAKQEKEAEDHGSDDSEAEDEEDEEGGNESEDQNEEGGNESEGENEEGENDSENEEGDDESEDIDDEE